MLLVWWLATVGLSGGLAALGFLYSPDFFQSSWPISPVGASQASNDSLRRATAFWLLTVSVLRVHCALHMLFGHRPNPSLYFATVYSFVLIFVYQLCEVFVFGTVTFEESQVALVYGGLTAVWMLLSCQTYAYGKPGGKSQPNTPRRRPNLFSSQTYQLFGTPPATSAATTSRPSSPLSSTRGRDADPATVVSGPGAGLNGLVERAARKARRQRALQQDREYYYDDDADVSAPSSARHMHQD